MLITEFFTILEVLVEEKGLLSGGYAFLDKFVSVLRIFELFLEERLVVRGLVARLKRFMEIRLVVVRFLGEVRVFADLE